jgi:outer membrane protein
MAPLALLVSMQMQAAPLSPPTPPPTSTSTSTSSPTATPTNANVLHLDDAVQFALRHQPQIVQAHQSTEAQAGRSEQARSPNLPQVTGVALYNHAYGPLRSGTVVSGPGTGQYDFFSFGVTATQLIWDFGQSYEKYKAADRQVDSFKETERTVELTVLVNVRRAFFAARANKALIKVAEETVTNNEKHLRQTEGFVRAGTHPEIDVAQARSDIANSRVQLITAQNNYDISKAQLLQAMGAPYAQFDIADEDLAPVEGEDQPIPDLVARAIAGRPELAAIERQKESNELTVKGIKGAYYPALSAQAGASTAGIGLDALQPAWNVGATISWPIFQGGLTQGQVREAEANLGVTMAQLENERLQVRSDVETAALSVKAAKATIDAAQDALVNARERLRLAEGRYESGVGTIIELGDAQVALTNAAATVVQAQFNLGSARAQLLSALGKR